MTVQTNRPRDSRGRYIKIPDTPNSIDKQGDDRGDNIRLAIIGGLVCALIVALSVLIDRIALS